MSSRELSTNAGRLELADSELESGRVLRFAGEVDAATVDILAEAIGEAVNAGVARVWVDLSDVDFMDSSGVAALVRAAQGLEQTGIRLMVVCPAGPVRRLLELTGIEDAIALVSDVSVCGGGATRPAAAVPSPE